jgi:hypothetical protein
MTPGFLRVFGLIFTLSAALALAGPGLLGELPADQQAKLRAGEQISLTEAIEGKPWPKIRIYRTVNARPEEVMAVFVDYSLAHEYVPNVLKSTISNRISACTVDVDYALDVPILPDEFYTTRNILSAPGPDAYRVDWKLLRAVQTKDSVGSLRVEPFENKAVICYQNLVTPGSSMAGLLKGTAVKQMNQTVAAIAARVEKQRATNPEGLKREVAALRGMLGVPTGQ